jgi:hypothetical protein
MLGHARRSPEHGQCNGNALNTWLYEPDIGVDVVVSAPHTIAQLIEEQVVVGDVAQLPTAVVRASQILPATAETRLSPGDKLICLTNIAQAEALHHLVAHAAADD